MKHSLRVSKFRRLADRAALACAVAAVTGVGASRAMAYSTTTEPFSGITLTQSTQAAPGNLNFYLLTIDLSNPNISLLVTPPKNTADKIPDSQTTLSFVNNTGVQVGINANLFSAGTSTTWPNGSISGIAASQGNTYGAFDSGRPSVNFSAAKAVTFLKSLPPGFSLYNTVSGSDQIVVNGVNVANPNAGAAATSPNPRTAVGITADNKLLMLAADGGSSSSVGLTTSQEADLLIAYGAVNALNLDGGGSTTMVLRQGATGTVINNPTSSPLRPVKVNLGVYAAPATQQKNLMVYNDFYGGDQGTYNYAPTYSGSTEGVLSTSTNKAVQGSDAVARGWYDRLTINHDPSVTSVPDRPSSSWFVRLDSGATAGPSQNVARTITGYIGYWARTTTPDIFASIALDNPDGSSAGRGILQQMIADGQWHLYQWNLQNAAQWQAWIGTKGFNASTFTMDSLQFYGPDSNAIIDVDMISHNALGTLGPLSVPEPGSLAMVLAALCPAALLGRRRKA